jgi:Salmonella virulence plasmid 65kDa B protein
MLRRCLRSRLLRGANLVAAFNFVITPTFGETVLRRLAPPDALSRIEPGPSDNVSTKAIRLTRNDPQSEFLGLKLRLPDDRVSALDYRDDVSVLVQCSRENMPAVDTVRNVTRGCTGYSVFTTAPVTIEVPYNIDREIEESAIAVFKTDRTVVAALGTVRPLESFIDTENKRTVATLREQSGRYIAGVLKTLERPDRAPPAFNGQSLSSLRRANPLTGVPIIAKPQPNSMGDAKLTFPFELPGVRGDFAPSISINYASKSGYGPLGESWHLTIPEITVETRWGVPIYDWDFETETYLFNGEQLVPEAGESFVQDPSDQLHLVPMPHRTTALRPRKKGEARFVLRRDDGLWRFIRHGTEPDDYWWEAWQEKPGSGAPKVSYFGNAPGRVTQFIPPGPITPIFEDVPNSSGKPQPSTFILSLGSLTANPNPTAISKWVLAREVDAHRNVIDYDWHLDCQPAVVGDDGTCANPSSPDITSRELLLRRILYTSSLATEETVLRCRETPTAKGCGREWALYEVLFTWLPPDQQYRRSDARSGGLTVTGRLLDRIDLRARQLKSPQLGDVPLEWSCSKPFAQYSFAYRGEFPDATDRGTGRAFLKSITKKVAGYDQIFRPRNQVPSASCALPGADANQWPKYTTRFDYDLSGARTWGEPGTRATVHLEGAETFSLVDKVRSTLFSGQDGSGPVAPSMLGTTATTDTSVGFYGGLNLFNPGKLNSFGVKGNSSNRTGYTEATALLDVDGDGVPDVVVRAGDGNYKVHRGLLDSDGALHFTDGTQLSVPAGFAGFNREPFQSMSGSSVEAYLLGTFFGAMSSSTSAMQDTYVADVNGDGKPDVVSNGNVFFNTSANGGLSFSPVQNGAFIDPRSRAGIPGAAQPSLLQSVLSSIPPRLPSEDNPRVDVVRTWRAPFSGDVIVRGSVVYAPGPVPSDLAGTQDQEGDPAVKQVRLKDHRTDGLVFTVERNTRRGWDRAAPVQRCFAAVLKSATPPPSPQTITLQTTAPDGKTPVPVVSCYDGTRPEWPSMPQLPPDLGADKGLLVSVDAGDVLYFRTHVVDNAQDDVVRFAPAIDYIRLAEDSAGAGANPVSHAIIYGAGAPSNSPGVSAVISSLRLDSSACATLNVIDPTGASSQVEETKLGLCDRWGRSIVRYRAVEEQDRFVKGSGLLIAPFTGRMHFEGILTKPETPFAGDVAIRILPAPPAPDVNGNVSQPDPGCRPDAWEVPNTKFKSILMFGPGANSYNVIDPNNSDSLFFVNRGDRVCVFLRFWSTDERAPGPTRAIAWPEDLSRFSWQNGGLSALFDRKLLIVQLDKPGRNPDDLLPDVDKSAVQVPLGECPPNNDPDPVVRFPSPGEQTAEVTGAAAGTNGVIRLTVNTTSQPTTNDTVNVSGVTGTTEANGTWPITVIDATHIELQGSTFVHAWISGGTVMDPRSWTGQRTLPLYRRCVVVSDRHWVAPRLLGNTYGYFLAGAPGTSVAPRFARRLTPIKLPASDLTCRADNTLREYRFKLDLGTTDQPTPIPIDADTRLSAAYGTPGTPGYRPSIATSRVLVSVLKDGRRQPALIRAFVVRPRGPGEATPVLLGDSDLVDPFSTGVNDKLNDLNPESLLGWQVFRHIPPDPNVTPVPSADDHDALYAEFKVASTGPNDDGMRVYPMDRVGYSFCAPDQADIEVTTVVDDVAPNDKAGDRLLASGQCETVRPDLPDPVCPVASVSVRFALKTATQPTVFQYDAPIFAIRRSPIDGEFYRGWGTLAITTEFVEDAAGDLGTPAENPTLALSSAKADQADTPEKLPTVRDFNRLRVRLAQRQGGGPRLKPRPLRALPCTTAPAAGQRQSNASERNSSRRFACIR